VAGPRRIAFAGTPPFAATILEALIASHEVGVVYCQPARPSGRGRRLRPSAVEALASVHRLPIETPRTLRAPQAAETLARHACEVMVVAAYGLLLPPAILDTPPLGCINVHASLLPRWRGAAPIERAIMAGDPQTGVSIMQMDAGLDTGPVITRATCPILDSDTGDTLSSRLAELGARTLLGCLEDPVSWRPEPQSEWGITYAEKLTARDATIEWSGRAQALTRTIRALNSRLPATTWLGEERLRILEAHPAEGQAPPGTIIAFDRHALVIACGAGAVAATRVQLTRGKGRPLAAADFFNGYRDAFPVGARLGPKGAPPGHG
jgi:methionyl-tRNA formyltransferase